jgi:hypothetical protein
MKTIDGDQKAVAIHPETEHAIALRRHDWVLLIGGRAAGRIVRVPLGQSMLRVWCPVNRRRPHHNDPSLLSEDEKRWLANPTSITSDVLTYYVAPDISFDKYDIQVSRIATMSGDGARIALQLLFDSYSVAFNEGWN